MKSIVGNIKRQIESVGLALSHPEYYKKSHLSELFKKGEATIDRDFDALREDGIEIRFRKKRGAIIAKELDISKIKNLIIKYFGIINADSKYDRATNLIVQKLKHNALIYLILIQRAIESRRIIKFEYQKAGEESKERRVAPLLIFQRQGYYRLLAKEFDEIKQFHLTKIRSLNVTDTGFPKVSSKNYENLFENSLEAWLSPNKYHVKLRFNGEWAKYLIPTLLIENQVMIEEKDGSYRVELTVNRLEELAYWIVPRGEGVFVVSPPELKKMVIDLASKTLGNYTS